MRWALALVFAGCSELTDPPNIEGDAFPINVQNTSGAILVGMTATGVSGLHTAVVDVLSPVTLIDRGSAAPRIDTRDLTLFGARTPGGDFDVARASLLEKSVITLHPCNDLECQVGTGIGPRAFDALLGASAFKQDALRIRLADNQIFVLPDVAGSETHRSRSCDSVLPEPFRGGGTLVLGGTELDFDNVRIAIDTCVAPNPDPLLVQSARGADALFVLSTAFGTSMITESMYARYRELDPSAPTLDQLPSHTVFLPSGPVEGSLTVLPSLALVGNSTASPRAPCRQMYAHALLAQHDCAAGDDCPCTDTTFCNVPAIVHVATPISVIVVPDSEPTLQALRTELRPDRPEVDGILGTEALLALEVDIDYPHNRVLARCVDRSACVAHPELTDRASRSYVNACVE